MSAAEMPAPRNVRVTKRCLPTTPVSICAMPRHALVSTSRTPRFLPY